MFESSVTSAGVANESKNVFSHKKNGVDPQGQNSFSQKLTTLLWKKGLSQAEFARQLGCSVMLVSKWATGKSRPRYEDLIKIAGFFGVSIDFLLGREIFTGFPEPTSKDVKDNFRCAFGDLILGAGLSQTDVGKILGVPPQHVNKWLIGLIKPTHEILLKISKTFNVSVDFLLGNDAPKKEAAVPAVEHAEPQQSFEEAAIAALREEIQRGFATYFGKWLDLTQAATYCNFSKEHFNKVIRPLVSEDQASRPVIFDRDQLDRVMQSRQIGNLPSCRKGSTSATMKGGSTRG